MPSLLKIGFSLKDPALRARELANTGSPHPYKVEYEALLDNPLETEQRAHRHLGKLREGREWFRCELQQAISAIQLVAQGPIFLENRYSSPGEAKREVNAATAISEKPASGVIARPPGTYEGACTHCRANVQFTLHPSDTSKKCPECFRLTLVSGFRRRNFVI
jgi:hypothetical protein